MVVDWKKADEDSVNAAQIDDNTPQGTRVRENDSHLPSSDGELDDTSDSAQWAPGKIPPAAVPAPGNMGAPPQTGPRAAAANIPAAAAEEDSARGDTTAPEGQTSGRTDGRAETARLVLEGFHNAAQNGK